MMQRITIKQYDDLTYDQWKRVVRSVKRQTQRIIGASCEIGIGRKITDGQPTTCQVAARVYLPNKRQRVAASHRVPQQFSVRLRRPDKKYDLVTLRSDVESLADFVPTSARVRSGRRNAAAGFLLRWMRDGDQGVRDTQWGFLTAGHVFDGSDRQAVTVRVNTSTRFECRRWKAPGQGKRSDIIVLRIVEDRNQIETKLVHCGLITKTNPQAIRFLTTAEVHRAAGRHRHGRTFFPGGDAVFVGEEVFPDGFRLGTRKLDDCVRVAQSPKGTFARGTSGAYWRFGSKPACLQVGGKAPDFREGVGQPVDRFLPWIRSALGRSAKIVAVLD